MWTQPSLLSGVMGMPSTSWWPLRTQALELAEKIKPSSLKGLGKQHPKPKRNTAALGSAFSSLVNVRTTLVRLAQANYCHSMPAARR